MKLTEKHTDLQKINDALAAGQATVWAALEDSRADVKWEQDRNDTLTQRLFWSLAVNGVLVAVIGWLVMR